jgi:hypothetical protein
MKNTKTCGSWNWGLKRWIFEHEIHSIPWEQNEEGNLQATRQWYDKCPYVGFGQPTYCFLLAKRRLKVEHCFHHWHSNSNASGLDVKV